MYVTLFEWMFIVLLGSKEKFTLNEYLENVNWSISNPVNYQDMLLSS